MKNNKQNKDTIFLILLLLLTIGSLITTMLLANKFIATCMLGISTLLTVNQLKKMNIKL
jgi:hypothetical protein